MQSLALVLTAIAVLGMTAQAILSKHLMNVKAFTEKELIVAKCGIATVACLLTYLFTGDWWNSLAPEKTDSTMWWVALAITTAANIPIQLGNIRARRYADLSFVAPISAMTPGLVVLSALLIGESPGTLGILGITLIVVGTYVHAREGTSRREYFMPLLFWLSFRNIDDLPADEQRKLRGLRWAYAAALFSTIALLGDGLVARHGNVILAVTIELAVLTLVYLIALPKQVKDEGAFALWDVRRRAKGFLLGLFGITFAIPFITLGIAFRLAPIAEIGSLKRLSIVLTVIGGAWLLSEKSGVRRTLLASVIVAGAILIAFDPTPGVVLNSFDAYVARVLGR